MKIVDQFSFSDKSELDVLLVHLELGKDVINQWLIIENEFTFQGDKKGFELGVILQSDTRFQTFLDRIELFEVSYSLDCKVDKKEIFDEEARKVEEFQRESTREYILNNYADEDIVLLSDTDECVDFSDANRRKLLFNKLGGSVQHIKIPHTRFWYDYDNLWSEIRSIPAVRVSYLKESSLTFSRIRFYECGTGPEKLWSQQVAFEYSFCFGKNDIYKKYDSFFHTGVTKHEIDQAIESNRLVVSSLRKSELSLDRRWWLRKVKLTALNSPQYVRENLEKLQVNVIPENYSRARSCELDNIRSHTPFWSRLRFTIGYWRALIQKRRV